MFFKDILGCLLFLYLFNTSIFDVEGRIQPNINIYDNTERKAYLTRLIADFVIWPNETTSFVIGVYNDEEFYKYLSYLYKEVEFKGRKPKVLLITDLNDVSGNQILFLTQKSHEKIDQILKLTINRPILTVGDQKDFGHKGVIINFYDDQNEVKFEINFNSYKNSELKIDSRLFDVAKIID